MDSAELEYTQHASTGHFQVEMAVEDDIKESVFITKDVEYFKRADVRKNSELLAMLEREEFS